VIAFSRPRYFLRLRNQQELPPSGVTLAPPEVRKREIEKLIKRIAARIGAEWRAYKRLEQEIAEELASPFPKKALAELPPDERAEVIRRIFNRLIAEEIRQRPLPGPETEVPRLRDYYSWIGKVAQRYVDASLRADFARRGILEDFQSMLRLTALEAARHQIPRMDVVREVTPDGKVVLKEIHPLRTLVQQAVAAFLRGYGYPRRTVGGRLGEPYTLTTRETPLVLPEDKEDEEETPSPLPASLVGDEPELERITEYGAARGPQQLIEEIKRKNREYEATVIIPFQNRVRTAKLAQNMAATFNSTPGRALRAMASAHGDPVIRSTAQSLVREAARAGRSVEEVAREWAARSSSDILNTYRTKLIRKVMQVIRQGEEQGKKPEQILREIQKIPDVATAIRSNPDVLGAIFGGLGSGIGLGIAFPTVSHIVKNILGNNHQKEVAMMGTSLQTQRALYENPEMPLKEREKRAVLGVRERYRIEKLFKKYPKYRQGKTAYLKPQYYQDYPDFPRYGRIVRLEERGGLFGIGATLYLVLSYMDNQGKQRTISVPAKYYQVKVPYIKRGGQFFGLIGGQRVPAYMAEALGTSGTYPAGGAIVQANPTGKRRSTPFNRKAGELIRKYLAEGMERKEAFRRAMKEASAWWKAQQHNPKAGTGRKRKMLCPQCGSALIVHGHGVIPCPKPGCAALLRV
jgi:hypothetical protein